MEELNEFKEWFDKNWDLETKEKFDELKEKYNKSSEEKEKEEIEKQMKDIIANQYGYYIFKIANEDDSPEQKLNNLLSEYINLENPKENRKSLKDSIEDTDVIKWLMECINNHVIDYENIEQIKIKLVNRLKHEYLLIENEETHKTTKINYPKAKKFIKKYEEKNNIKINNEIHNLLEKLIEEEIEDYIETLEPDKVANELDLQDRFKIKKYEAKNLIDRIIQKNEQRKDNSDDEKENNVIKNLLNSEYGLFNYPILDKPLKKEVKKVDEVSIIINKISRSGNVDGEIENLSESELDLLFNCIIDRDSDKYVLLLSELTWRKILEKVFENKYDILTKDLESINVLYDILLDIYKEMKEINLQFKRIPLTKEKYSELQKIFKDDFKRIYKTLNNINIMQEEIYQILEPDINSKILKYSWDNIVKIKFKTYGKNDEKLEKFNELLENHLRYLADIKDTETYLEEILNNDDILNDESNYNKILGVIDGIIFREKINNEYLIEDENKFINVVNEDETETYLNVHEEYIDRLNDWQKRSPLFRLKEPSELDIAIEELEKQKRL